MKDSKHFIRVSQQPTGVISKRGYHYPLYPQDWSSISMYPERIDGSYKKYISDGSYETILSLKSNVF